MSAVEVVDVETCPTAVIRTTTTFGELADTIYKSLDKVWPFLRSSGLTTNHNVVLYRGNVMAEEGGAVEIGVQVDRPFSDDGEVVCSELPATRVARTLHRGAYDQIGTAHAAVIEHCDREGLTRTGLSWEIYGDWSDDPEKLETEVAHELKA